MAMTLRAKFNHLLAPAADLAGLFLPPSPLATSARGYAISQSGAKLHRPFPPVKFISGKGLPCLPWNKPFLSATQLSTPNKRGYTC